ncbi:MAG: hypothetical protein U9R52_02695, partial [Candidatus Omnitrophota bacterium]|nr:hypothetical protein [Candidatus Omnitrophota bacterium]
GIGISGREKPVRKDIILYGKWKIKKGAGLVFEMKYGRNRLGTIKFGGEAKLIGNSGIKFTLKSKSGKGIGMSITLSRAMFKGNGESFLRFLRSKKEKAAYVGTGFMW